MRDYRISDGKITKDKLYQSALDLYRVKDRLEAHLSKRTNELFDLQDKIILYDLTNTYFEGEKKGSNLARFGRSKEKRSDARLIVLALVVNAEGFIKYSDVFEGNMSDSSSLPGIIDRIRVRTAESQCRAIVVLDAGIATEENLALIRANGYDYVCVSRTR
jgi:transposase